MPLVDRWALSVQPFDQYRPGRNKAIRYNVLVSNKCFQNRIDSHRVWGRLQSERLRQYLNGTSNYQQTKLMNKGVYAANYSD